MGITKVGPINIILGQSLSGKTNLLLNIIKHKLLFEYDLDKIYIFSLTAKTDLNYWGLFKLYAEEKQKLNIFTKIDFEKIETLIKSQESNNIDKMIALSWEDAKEIEDNQYCFIFDDILSDKEFKRFDSKLAMFSTLCWHYNIHQFILTQMWTWVPKTIR